MLEPAAALAAVRRDAGNMRAAIIAAEAMFANGQREDAVALLREAVALVPEDAPALRVLSGFLAACGDAAAAESLARQAAALAPENAALSLHLAHVLFLRQRHAQAVAPLRAAVARMQDAPADCAAAWHMLSIALLQAGQPAQALEASGRAISLVPDHVGYSLHHASLLNARACHGDALAELRRACAFAPEDAHVAHAMSGLLDLLGDLPAAFAQAERACALAPQEPVFAAQRDALSQRLGLLTAASDLPAPPRQAAPRPVTVSSQHTFVRGVAARGRIIWAIALREMRTRHSRATLGYLWALAEPISHLLTLGVIFAYVNEAPPPIGDNLFEFYCTGLLPYLLFAHISGEVMHARNAAGALLLLPRLRSTDIMLAHSFLTLMTELAVAILVFSAFGLAGARTVPAQPLTALLAFGLLTILALGVGAINMVLLHLFHGWETVYNAIVRLLYFASGIYYTPISMPDAVRNALVWNPVLQGVELFRSGFYPDYAPFWLNLPYLLWCCAGALALGLTLEQTLRRQLMVQT